MMKKILTVCMCGLMAAALMTGCAKKDSVKLGTYKGVSYTPVNVDVTDEDVEAELQRLLAAYPVITELEGPAKEGDTVNIDYVGMKDGVAFEGGTASGYDLTLGSGQFIDGFEDGLIGATPGQELSLNLTFPEQYQNAELAGQAVVFDVTVNKITQSSPAVLNDAFIAENTDYKTIAEYREGMKAELSEEAAANAENQKKGEVFQKVMEASEVKITDATVNAYFEKQMENYEKQAQEAGITLDDMISYYGMGREDFESYLKDMAKEATSQDAVVKAIAEKEAITVTDEELVALAEEFGYESKDDMFEKAGEDIARNYVLTENVVTFLALNAVEAAVETTEAAAE